MDKGYKISEEQMVTLNKACNNIRMLANKFINDVNKALMETNNNLKGKMKNE